MPNVPVIGQAGQPTYTVTWSASISAPNAEMAATEALSLIVDGKLAAREFIVTTEAAGAERVDLFPRGRAAQMLALGLNTMIKREDHEVMLENFGRLRKVECSGLTLELYFEDDPRDGGSTDYIFADYIAAELSPQGNLYLLAYESTGRQVTHLISVHRRQRVPLDDIVSALA